MNQTHCSLILVALLAGASSQVANAAFLTRASLDDHNVLAISAGNTTITLNTTNLGSKTYDVASTWNGGYVNTFVQGPTGEANYSIAIANTEGNSTPWETASLVFKITAPVGQTFTGGTLSFDTRHLGTWQLTNLVRWRAATFANEPNYLVSGSTKTYVDFTNALSSDFYNKWNGDGLGSGSNPYELLTVNVPTGVSAFYAVIGSPNGATGNDSIRLGGIQFSNVTTIPEPASLALLGVSAVALLRRRRG